MPAKKSRGKMFREFSKLNQRYVKNNHLKYLRKSVNEFCVKRDIFEKPCRVLQLWQFATAP